MILQLLKTNHTIETHVGLQKNTPLQTDIFVENRPSQKETIVLLIEKNPANSPVEVSSLSHYLQGFVHPRWLALRFLVAIPRSCQFQGIHRGPTSQ